MIIIIQKGDNLSNLEPLREKEMRPLALGESGKSNFFKKGHNIEKMLKYVHTKNPWSRKKQMVGKTMAK